ncbi:MAG: twin-arginine translocation signal domain-containing protein [Gammaproteobacteria bacterium]
MSDKSIINRLSKQPSGRRAFLQKSCVAAVSGAALSAVANPVLAGSQQTVQEDAPKNPERKGYRLSQHVLDYYKTAAL